MSLDGLREQGSSRPAMSERRVRQHPGQLIARLLSGSWRSNPPEFDFSEEEIEAVIPQLLGSGAGALGWKRIKDSALRTSPVAAKLQQAYRLHTLYAGLHEVEIEQIINLLRSRGVEPLLIKGRAAASLYPELGLRPYGDIDLCFDSAHFSTASEVLKTPEGMKINVDAHKGLDDFYGLPLIEVLDNAQTIKVGEIKVLVPCFEHHLRILCIHFLKHGAWRPLSLCDIAAALEQNPGEIDWDLCVGKDKRVAGWVSCTVRLAQKLLGANAQDIPWAANGNDLPRWVAPAVLKQWERPYPEWNETPEYLKIDLRKPVELKTEIQKRWPNPIKATVYFNGSFNRFPRLPFQLMSFISLGLRSLGRFARTT